MFFPFNPPLRRRSSETSHAGGLVDDKGTWRELRHRLYEAR
jgi:hypothetical protein